MTTYKQFLIHDNNRAYLDHSGKLTPMFVYTEFSTLDEVKARIDRYWSEWEEFENKRKVNTGKSFEILKTDVDLHDESTELEVDKWNERIELHETIKLMEP